MTETEFHLRQELRCMNQNLATARETINELRAEVARLEEQKVRMAFDIEAARNTARFFKRKLDSQQPRATLASRNRPKEPGLQEKTKEMAAEMEGEAVYDDDEEEVPQEGKEEEEEAEDEAELLSKKPRPSSSLGVTLASRSSQPGPSSSKGAYVE